MYLIELIKSDLERIVENPQFIDFIKWYLFPRGDVLDILYGLG